MIVENPRNRGSHDGMSRFGRWRLIGSLVAFVAMALACAVRAPIASATVADTPDTASQAQQETEQPRCVDALSRILPGAFDYCLARKRWTAGWYNDSLGLMQRAAAWGNKDAQLALGITYFNGDHVPANRPLGLAWLGLAAERRESMPLQLLASAYAKATPEEKRRAQALMNEMWPTYADATAAVRADEYYRRAVRRLVRQGSGDQGLCLDGISSTTSISMGSETVKPLFFTHYANGVATATTGRAESEFPAANMNCPSVTSVVRTLDSVYVRTMHGWAGEVSVGDLETVHDDDKGGRVGQTHAPARE